MSYETDFDAAFTILLGKAAGVITQTGVITPPTTSGTSTGISTPATAAIEFGIDGGGSVITSGIKGGLIVPFNCEITQVDLQEFNGITGSITVDIKKATSGASPSFSSITASAIPGIALARYYTDSALTGWTTALSRGDALQYVASSISSLTNVLVMMYVRRTDLTT